MGKGSKRRPCLVSQREFEKNWDEAFRKEPSAMNDSQDWANEVIVESDEPENDNDNRSNTINDQ